MSAINSSTSSAKVGRSQARFASSNDMMSNSTFKRSPLLKDSDSDLTPSLKDNTDTERLQRENAKLKMELEDLRAQYQQLLEEGKEETFDERRVNLLKAHVMQLERQRSHTECLFSFTPPRAALRLCKHRGPTPETGLTGSLQARAGSRPRSSRAGAEGPRRPLTSHPCGRLCSFDDADSCCLPLPALLQSALESRLSQLFKHLHGMRQTLGFILAPGPDPGDQARQLLTPAAYARLLNQVTHCSQELDRCCSDLLTLSLIIPSAPWASTEQEVTQELSADAVLALLPAFPRGAPQQRARRAAEALARAANYSRMMAMKQVEALQAELDFHRSLYSLQIRYTEGLIQAIRQAYQVFQENVAQSLCAPLQDVLSCYDSLKSTASEAALRDFLTAFKNNSEQIQEAAEALDPSKSQGDEALSRYGKEFFSSVEELLKDCASQRDRAANELQLLKSEYDKACASLQALRKERRERRAAPRQQGAPPGAGGAEGAGRDSPSENRADEEPESQAKAATAPAVLLKPKPSALRKALSADLPSATSETGASQQSRVTQRPTNRGQGKSPTRSKSLKVPPRPSWQS
ncbi:uncharacterized protein LOC118776475 [Megalops cyprinoides]|uniref:uncharacterized protein LOC118776475 n=1 Tax=Megalops cyprinoides TaxID=118141 RepID=UPI001864B3E8|nr:uncharacterized protein LOC118776475 [Megalops cyprinoides]